MLPPEGGIKSQDVEHAMSDDRAIVGGVAGSHARLTHVERHLHAPVQTVLDGPVTSVRPTCNGEERRFEHPALHKKFMKQGNGNSLLRSVTRLLTRILSRRNRSHERSL